MGKLGNVKKNRGREKKGKWRASEGETKGRELRDGQKVERRRKKRGKTWW